MNKIIPNNKLGGVNIEHNINFYWIVGKFINSNKNKCLNIIEKVSDYLSYYYGDSYNYSYQNIIYMKKMYLYFPIYDKRFEKLSWKYYIELFKLNNKEILYFYFKISLFCNLDFFDFKNMITSQIYFRI